MPYRVIPEAIVGKPGLDRCGMDLSTLGKKFYAGCPFCRSPPHLSELGTGIRKHRNVPPMAGFLKLTKIINERKRTLVNLQKNTSNFFRFTKREL